MISFEELCKARAKAGEWKYLICECPDCGFIGKSYDSRFHEGKNGICTRTRLNSVNAALHRNSALDVAEELADAINIAELWKSKLTDSVSDNTVYQRIQELQDFLKVWGTRCMMRAEYGKDDYPIKRIGFEEPK